MSNTKIIRPYVSKKKRKLEEEARNIEDETKLLKVDVKSIFITNETVWKKSLKQITNLPRKLRCSLKISSIPVWDIAWCPKFSHLLAITKENTIGLYDVIKDNTITHVYNVKGHTEGVKSVDWSNRGRRLASCSYDRTVKVFDFLDSGKCISTFQTDELPNVVKFWPNDENIVLIGADNNYLKSFDIRSHKQIVNYDTKAGNILSFDFFNNDDKVLITGDLASRQSAEHSLAVWDVHTGAKISQQMYHERFSCPFVKRHPSDASLLAQSNGNYIARFSANRPFSLDKTTRYEGHRVEGFPVQFDISSDGCSIASGSSDGKINMYQYKNSALLYTINLNCSVSVCALSWNPEMRDIIAATDFDGYLHLLH